MNNLGGRFLCETPGGTDCITSGPAGKPRHDRIRRQRAPSWEGRNPVDSGADIAPFWPNAGTADLYKIDGGAPDERVAQVAEKRFNRSGSTSWARNAASVTNEAAGTHRYVTRRPPLDFAKHRDKLAAFGARDPRWPGSACRGALARRTARWKLLPPAAKALGPQQRRSFLTK